MKSEKAKEYIINNLEIVKGSNVMMLSTVAATEAVEIAEQEISDKLNCEINKILTRWETSDRKIYDAHVRELQELKDKAIQAFKGFVDNYCHEAGHYNISNNTEHYIEIFKQLLNE